MKMDQDNNMVPSAEERSVSTGNEDIFDFKNLRNCLPTTNQLEKSRELRKITMDVMNSTRMSRLSTMLKIVFAHRRSADFGNSSTSQETEEDAFGQTCGFLKGLARAVVGRTACELPGKQKNPRLSSALVSGRSHLNSQESIESKRIALRRNISLRRETDKLMKECSSRGLSIEEMDELERKSIEEQISRKKEKMLLDLQRSYNLVKKKTSVYLGSADLGNSSTSQETEGNTFGKTREGLERLAREVVEIAACELSLKQKNPRLSSPLVSGRSHLNSQESIESKRIALGRNISLRLESVSVEEMDELERKSAEEKISRKKKKMPKEIKRCYNRLQKKIFVYLGSDDFGNSSTSQETKENTFGKMCRGLERLAREVVERTACELPGKQKKPRLSSPLVSGRSHLNSQESIESKRIALRRNISIHRESVSVEEMDELERKSEELQILRKKKKILKEIQRCYNRLRLARSKYVRKNNGVRSKRTRSTKTKSAKTNVKSKK